MKVFNIVVVLILELNGCALSNHKWNGTRAFINHYSSYDEMVEAEEEFINRSNETKKKHILFDLNLNEYKRNYYIGGICRCNSYLIKKKHTNDKCDYLTNRELFVSYIKNNETFAILIYKDVDLNYSLESNVSWIESDGGGEAYRYEQFKYEKAYILKDQFNNHLVGIKFSNHDENLEKPFFETIEEILKLANI